MRSFSTFGVLAVLGCAACAPAEIRHARSEAKSEKWLEAAEIYHHADVQMPSRTAQWKPEQDQALAHLYGEFMHGDYERQVDWDRARILLDPFVKNGGDAQQARAFFHKVSGDATQRKNMPLAAEAALAERKFSEPGN